MHWEILVPTFLLTFPYRVMVLENCYRNSVGGKKKIVLIYVYTLITFYLLNRSFLNKLVLTAFLLNNNQNLE